MAKQLVDDGIKNNTVFVISKSYCPYCKKAKKYLKDAGIEFVAVEIENHPDSNEIQDYCASLVGSRSVPKVWIKQKFVGGGDDIEALYKKGQLKL